MVKTGVQGLTSLKLDRFSGLNTLLDPTNLPPWASPSTQNCEYYPGLVKTRPGLTPQFSIFVGTFTGMTTYILPDDVTKRFLAFNINGIGTLYKDVAGTLTPISSAMQADYCNFAPAFGRSYMAFGDEKHGVDIPRAYDDVHFDRVSQTGPGAGPTSIVQEQILISTLVRTANIMAVTLVNPFPVAIGDMVNISGADDNSFNGTFPVCAVTDTLHFSVFNAAFTFPETVLTRVTGTVTAVVSEPMGAAGPDIVVTSADDPTFNGRFTIASNPAPNTYTWLQAGTDAAVPDGVVTGLIATDGGDYPIIAANVLGGVCTVTTNPPFSIQPVAYLGPLLASGLTMDSILPGGLGGPQTTTAGMDQTSYSFATGVADGPVAGFLGAAILRLPNASASGGTIGTSGSITIGLHLVSVSFITRNGYITKPSPPIRMVSLGARNTTISGIPTGPSNAIARLLMFTAAIAAPATTGPFFTIESSMQINDNVTTILPVNFTDDELIAGTPTDYLFNQVELGECAGLVQYASRLCWWGERAKLEPNLLNMDFNGGWEEAGREVHSLFTTGTHIPVAQLVLQNPTADIHIGDTLVITGNSFAAFNNITLTVGSVLNPTTFLVNATIFSSYFADTGGTGGFTGPGGFQVPLGWIKEPANGDGGSKVTSRVFGDAYAITGDGINTFRGTRTQPALMDFRGTPIIQINKAYSVRVKYYSTVIVPATTVSLGIELKSASMGSLGGTSFTVTPSLDVAEFIGPLMTEKSSLPSDLIFAFYGFNLPNTGDIVVVSLEVFETALPYNGSILRISGSEQPDAYDGVTGLLQPNPNNGQDIRNAFTIRDFLYVVKESSLYVTQDDGQNEPSQWQIREVSNAVGTLSSRGVGIGEEWALIAGRSGVYYFNGGEPQKISQEIQPTWDQINWNYGHLIEVRVDTKRKRAYIAVPFGTSTTNNFIFTVDYVDGWGDPLQNDGVGRKWNPWTIASGSLALIEQDDNTNALFIGGLAGRIYLLDPSATSDNHNLIDSYWQSGFFQDGVRLMFGYMSANIVGNGQCNLTIRRGGQNDIKAVRGWILTLNGFNNLERGINENRQRMAIAFETNQIDEWFSLQGLEMFVGQSLSPIRGINS